MAEAITEAEKKLIQLLKAMRIDKDDGLWVSLASREYGLTAEIVNYIESECITDPADVLNWIGEKIDTSELEVSDDDE